MLIIFKIMASFFQAISLSPQYRFWRVKGEAKVKDTFGGIASLLLLLSVGAILLIQMIDVFSRNTAFINTEHIVGTTNVQASIKTSQIDQNIKPTMLAFKANSQFFSNTAKYITQNNSSSITLEPCTINHFQGVQNITLYYSWYQIDTFNCLPLNSSYTFGGGRFANEYNYIQNQIACTAGLSNCSQSKIELIILSSTINPTNNEQPWIPYLKRYSYQGSVNQQFTHKFSQNVLHSKNGVFPLEEGLSTTHGYQLQQNTEEEPLTTTTGIQINFLFTTSEKKVIYNRSYLTVIDALSYVGGIFNAILAAFIFMSFYGQVFFEIFFAQIYFKSRDAQSFGFFSFLKLNIYNLLVLIGCKPRWDLSQKGQKLRQTVQNTMNVVYLQRRIDFLEKSMTILLDKHHLKGLHLLHRLTQKEANDNFKEYRFRDRLIGYFRMRARGDRQNKKQRKKETKEIEESQKYEVVVQKTQSAE